MRQWSGKDLARLVEGRGWSLLRIKGSHHIYGRSGIAVRIFIPIYGNTPLKTDLLRHLAKVAGISDDEL